MFKWLKRLFGNASSELQEDTVANIVNETTAPEPVAEATPADKPKKKSKKGSGKTCDFSKLTKTQLLAEAKHRGVKANASMKKQDILDRLNASSKK